MNEAVPSDADLFQELWSGKQPQPPPEEESQPPEESPPPEEGEEAPEATESKPAEATPPAAPSWRDSLPEEARVELEALEKRQQNLTAALESERNARQALQGRVPGLQRQLTEYEKTLAQLREKPPAAAGASATVSDLDSMFDSEEWKQYAADFPIEAKLMRDAVTRSVQQGQQKVSQLEEQIRALEPQLASLHESVGRVRLAEERAELERSHPDWKEYNTSDEFWAWFEEYRAAQPDDFRGKLYDNDWLGSQFQRAPFVSQLLTQYKRDLYLANLHEQSESPPAEAPSQESPPAPTARARLATAPAVRGASSAPRRTSIENLPEADAFELLWNQRDQT